MLLHIIIIVDDLELLPAVENAVELRSILDCRQYRNIAQLEPQPQMILVGTGAVGRCADVLIDIRVKCRTDGLPALRFFILPLDDNLLIVLHAPPAFAYSIRS